MLYDALPEDARHVPFEGKTVCTIQKEYPTATKLGKPRRQNWDVCVIRVPPSALPGGEYPYDYLTLDSVIEFGLNEERDHLEDDIRRLSMARSYVDNAFIVHLYRLSRGAHGKKASDRDWSPKSKLILRTEEVAKILGDNEIELFYGMYDESGTYETGAWRIRQGQPVKL